MPNSRYSCGSMTLPSSWLTTLLLYSTYCVGNILGYEEIINIDSGCSFSIKKPNEDKSFKLVWNGADPGYGGCKISFIGRDSEYLNEYTVCVEAERFYLQSSGIYLRYYVGFNSYASKTYTKGEYPEKFCAGQDQYLDVEIEADSGSIFSRIDTSQSYFTLKITASKTYDYGATVGAIVGGVLGGLALLGVAVTVCIIIACRRKRYAGQVNRPAVIPSQGGSQSAAYPQQTGGYVPPGTYPQQQTVGYGQPGSYPQQPMAYPPPTGHTSAYPIQGYPGQQYPPPQGQNNAAPPPSYGDVTKPS